MVQTKLIEMAYLVMLYYFCDYAYFFFEVAKENVL